MNGEIAYQEHVNSIEKWYLIDTWLNNQALMLERYRTLPESSALDTPLPVTLLNPFTGESRDLENDFPNILPFFDPLISWNDYGKSGTAYDPRMTLVAYARVDLDGRQFIVLWDLVERRETTSLQAPIGFSEGPAWSPDGSHFITVSLTKIPGPHNWTEEQSLPQELFRVSRSGETILLTHFTDQFQEVSISDYVWSPDGNRIAFWVRTKPDDEQSENTSGYRLAVLDVSTK